MPDQAKRDAAADLIDKGMDLLHERGWCKGHLEDAQGRMCLDGALRTADGQNIWRDHGSVAYFIALQMIEVEVPASPFAAAFNDHPDTTLEDVLLVGKRAAHSLREVAA